MMCLGVEFCRLVALPADRIPLGAQLLRVRVVAIGAGHPLGKHPALEKRAVVEHFVLHLPVGPVEAPVEQTRTEAVGEWLPRVDLIGQLRASRMTTSACLDRSVLPRPRGGTRGRAAGSVPQAMPERTGKRATNPRLVSARGAPA